MAEWTCHNCVYSYCDECLWLRRLWAGEPILPMCANHPRWPGTLREVPGVPCRNYRRRPTVPERGVRLIPLCDGGYVYVSAADYDWLSRYNWRLYNGYAGRYDREKKVVLMHREIMKPPKGKVVDHIDGNKANNCRFNLRVCTRQENMRNKRKSSSSYSRFKCVFRDKRTGKWYARCKCEGKPRTLGSFDDEAEAARAYDRMAVEWFGEYARPNFPEEWPPERRAQVYAQRQEAEGKKASTHAEARGPGKRKGNAEPGRASGRKPCAATSKTPGRKAKQSATA